MGVLFAGLHHETHCFVDEHTSLDDFRIERSEEILYRRGDGSPVDGFLEMASRCGWEIMPAVHYAAMPAGRVEDRVFENFWTETTLSLQEALNRGLSGVFLSLHGAMATDSIDDVEGELLERLRNIPGMEAVPVFGIFDLHASFTERMARYADGLVCYRENPHIDARESAMRAAGLLHRTLSTGQVPRIVRLNPPIIWPPTGTGTADSPMCELEEIAREIEAKSPDIWAVNVVGGYAFSDTADAGVSFSVVTVGSKESAQIVLAELYERALALKERGLVEEHSADEVLQTIACLGRGPILLLEPADNIGAGAPGDGTGVLRALLRHHVEDSAVIINDPECVAALASIPVGGTMTLHIGGKRSPLGEGPVELDVDFVSKSNGRFELEDPQSHLAAMQGRHIDMGPCAVVRHQGITILLTSRKTPPFDLGQLRSQGIEPRELSVIGVKAAVAHRRAYDPIAVASYTVRTRGPCTSDPRNLPYRLLRRPIYPLDPLGTDSS
jgi:microcystin degradation protein MlrC